jgi:hypothetical protein
LAAVVLVAVLELGALAGPASTCCTCELGRVACVAAGLAFGFAARGCVGTSAMRVTGLGGCAAAWLNEPVEVAGRGSGTFCPPTTTPAPKSRKAPMASQAFGPSGGERW